MWIYKNHCADIGENETATHNQTTTNRMLILIDLQKHSQMAIYKALVFQNKIKAVPKPHQILKLD